MKTKFTRKFILSNYGCYSEEHTLVLIGKKTSLTIEEILSLNIPLKDKAWWIRNKCELSIKELREFSIGCALCVLPIYENKYPDNKAPREAIEAAKAYLAGTIDLTELRKKRNAAAAAAAAAAYAANAAAAAYAAYAAAAAYAAYAAVAAYAAYAAAAAAAAYAAYAADVKQVSYKDLLLTFFKGFMKSNKP